MSGRHWFWLSVVAFGGAWVLSAAVFPDRVPMHFDASGDVDRWAGRTEALVTMGLVGAAVALLLGGLGSWVRRAPLRHVNVPHRAWWTATPEREAELRSRLPGDLFAIGTATMVLLAGVELLTLRAARLSDPYLDGWVWVLLGGYLAFVAAWTAYLLIVRYRPDSA